MRVKIGLLFWFFFFLFLCPTEIFSQYRNNKLQKCDSLINANENMLHPKIDKLPIPVNSFAEIQNVFLSKVDTNKMNKTILIKAFIDTCGNVICPLITIGNQDSIDTLALEYFSTLKFIPGEIAGKKTRILIGFPFFKNTLTETNSLIKRDSRWYDKAEE